MDVLIAALVGATYFGGLFAWASYKDKLNKTALSFAKE